MSDHELHRRRSGRLRFRPSRLAAALAAGLLSLGFALGEDQTPPEAGTARNAVPAFRQASTVGVITVRGEIDLISLSSLERRIEKAVADGCDAVVLDIDTPGGRLDATLDICNLLKDPSVTPTNVVAWVHPQAYSAGAIISLACREIVVAPNGTFGDAAPIQGIPIAGLIQMAETERAKIEAPILAEVVDSARRNHYDENLLQAFVSVGVELWLIENVGTGEQTFVNRQEYAIVFGEAPPDEMTAVSPSSAPAAGSARGVVPRFNTAIPRPEPGEADALTAEQIREQIEFQQQLPPSRAPLTEADRDQWKLVTQVISNDRLLTVKQAEALYFGLAVATVANDDQLKAFFGAQTLVRYDRSWSESLVRLLVSAPVRIILIVVFLVSLFIELAAPGVGVFGAAALAALLVLIGAPSLAGMAQWWDLLLIGLGLVLIMAEVFVIPGFGVAGVAGAVCLLAGLVGTFVSADLSSQQGMEELGTGIASILTAIFAAAVAIWLVSRQVHSFPILNRLMLRAELSGAGPAEVGLLAAMAPASATLAVGADGVAETDLRPAGRGLFDGRIVDVQSPGRYIDKGTPIRVTKVGTYVVEVEAAER